MARILNLFFNDGSTDDLLIILNDSRNAYNLRITVIDQQNVGVSSAKNVGIESAQGDLICFCDVDDEVASGYISGMRSVLDNNSEVDVVFFKYDIVISSDKVVYEKSGTGEVKVS
jgi:glycosyltransferase involved in cell wall biosynthesis